MDLYLQMREWLLKHDADAPKIWTWSQNVVAPESAEQLAGEIVWIVLCAGRSAQAARTLAARIWEAISNGGSACDAFGFRSKASAIDRIWGDRDANFARFEEVRATGSSEALLEWCGSLDWVGNITKYQLAKNLGAAVVKPDRWLVRLAGLADESRVSAKVRFDACMALCYPLAEAAGERVASVDSLLWLACNKGVLVVDNRGGPVSLNLEVGRRRSIYMDAPTRA
ncbi:hypothetical protein [Burkholderia sp. MBR-1]|uniref:hypothetical protein n=1 Tax=Burkholderia sp. MBR-1 TaxID=2732364 RepID=UPI0015EE8C99|nr:hypothetical protein [Burkholderia sp. MBR-1]QMI49720.1 hypothetical protein MBR110_30050 [Burkholderia sp. MBR-1]